MKTKIKMRILILGGFLISSILTAEEPLVWPEPIKIKIDEILKAKEAAMQFPAMRSENGILGKRCEAIMAELGTMVTESELIRKLKTSEGKDIKVKIALWAIDRKKRPDEYKRFEKYYVNRPVGTANVIEYFSREPQGAASDPDPFAGPAIPENSIPRPGAWMPNSVDEEDQKEDFRLILEYCFYVPPTGKKFDEDLYRTHMMNALLALDHHDRSLIVMASDAEMAVSEEIRKDANGRNIENNYEPLHFMARVSIEQSFSMISKLWADNASLVQIQTIFNGLWKDQYVEERYREAKDSFDAWQALARKDWETSEEQELSKWILSLNPPRKIELPKAPANK